MAQAAYLENQNPQWRLGDYQLWWNTQETKHQHLLKRAASFYDPFPSGLAKACNFAARVPRFHVINEGCWSCTLPAAMDSSLPCRAQVWQSWKQTWYPSCYPLRVEILEEEVLTCAPTKLHLASLCPNTLIFPELGNPWGPFPSCSLYTEMQVTLLVLFFQEKDNNWDQHSKEHSASFYLEMEGCMVRSPDLFQGNKRASCASSLTQHISCNCDKINAPQSHTYSPWASQYGLKKNWKKNPNICVFCPKSFPVNTFKSNELSLEYDPTRQLPG